MEICSHPHGKAPKRPPLTKAVTKQRERCHTRLVLATDENIHRMHETTPRVEHPSKRLRSEMRPDDAAARLEDNCVDHLSDEGMHPRSMKTYGEQKGLCYGSSARTIRECLNWHCK